MNDDQKVAFDNLFPKRKSKILKIILTIIGVIVVCFALLAAYIYYADKQREAEAEQNYAVNVQNSVIAILKLNNDVHQWLQTTMKDTKSLTSEQIDQYIVRLANLRNIRTYGGRWDYSGTAITSDCIMRSREGCGWVNFTYTLKKPLGGVSEVLVSHTKAISDQAAIIILDKGTENLGTFISLNLLDDTRYWDGKNWSKPVALPEIDLE